MQALLFQLLLPEAFYNLVKNNVYEFDHDKKCNTLLINLTVFKTAMQIYLHRYAMKWPQIMSKSVLDEMCICKYRKIRDMEKPPSLSQTNIRKKDGA